jgi:hypothetical protein
LYLCHSSFVQPVSSYMMFTPTASCRTAAAAATASSRRSSCPNGRCGARRGGALRCCRCAVGARAGCVGALVLLLLLLLLPPWLLPDLLLLLAAVAAAMPAGRVRLTRTGGWCPLPDAGVDQITSDRRAAMVWSCGQCLRGKQPRWMLSNHGDGLCALAAAHTQPHTRVVVTPSHCCSLFRNIRWYRVGTTYAVP